MQQAFNQPISEFKNDAQYLKPGSDPKTATLADVTDANKNRLGLEAMSDSSRAFALNNFPAFINGRDAIFGLLSSRAIEQTNTLFTSLSNDPNALQEALKLQSQESEVFNTKVNAEFNRSFGQLFEQRATAEMDALTAANTRANETSPQVEERTGSSEGENVAAKMKKHVRFNDNPVSSVNVFERNDRKVHFAEKPGERCPGVRAGRGKSSQYQGVTLAVNMDDGPACSVAGPSLGDLALPLRRRPGNRTGVLCWISIKKSWPSCRSNRWPSMKTASARSRSSEQQRRRPPPLWSISWLSATRWRWCSR